MLVDYYVHYKAGHLKDSGGVDDQEVWYMDAMEIFTTEMSLAEKGQFERKHGKS
jgi:hypothetical protein